MRPQPRDTCHLDYGCSYCFEHSFCNGPCRRPPELRCCTPVLHRQLPRDGPTSPCGTAVPAALAAGSWQLQPQQPGRTSGRSQWPAQGRTQQGRWRWSSAETRTYRYDMAAYTTPGHKTAEARLGSPFAESPQVEPLDLHDICRRHGTGSGMRLGLAPARSPTQSNYDRGPPPPPCPPAG